jgi:hypothetical protein
LELKERTQQAAGENCMKRSFAIYHYQGERMRDDEIANMRKSRTAKKSIVGPEVKISPGRSRHEW